MHDGNNSYVDDILCIYKDTTVLIDALASINVMKQGSMGLTDHYLGASIEKVKMQDDKVMWETHSGDCCKVEISNMENTLAADAKSLL